MSTSPRFDVTTTGEAMIRLSVPAGERLEVASRLEAMPGGAEANLCVALARMGRRSAWSGGLPDSPLGRWMANHLRVAGVDLDGVIWSDSDRIGTYYVEFATPPRATQVIYDRADSVQANLTPADMDWNYLLDTRLLHLTGITPPLSEGCRAIVEEAVARARAADVPISFDVNYRSKLWSAQEAGEFILPLVQGIDLFFCGRSDAQNLLGQSGEPEKVVRELAEATQAKTVVLTLAEQGVMAWDGTSLHHVPAKPVTVIDRPGAGDGLAAGVICGWLDGDLHAGLETGVVLAALALTQFGDMIVTTPEEVESLRSTPGVSLVR